MTVFGASLGGAIACCGVLFALVLVALVAWYWRHQPAKSPAETPAAPEPPSHTAPEPPAVTAPVTPAPTPTPPSTPEPPAPPSSDA